MSLETYMSLCRTRFEKEIDSPEARLISALNGLSECRHGDLTDPDLQKRPYDSLVGDKHERSYFGIGIKVNVLLLVSLGLVESLVNAIGRSLRGWFSDYKVDWCAKVADFFKASSAMLFNLARVGARFIGMLVDAAVVGGLGVCGFVVACTGALVYGSGLLCVTLLKTFVKAFRFGCSRYRRCATAIRSQQERGTPRTYPQKARTPVPQAALQAALLGGSPDRITPANERGGPG